MSDLPEVKAPRVVLSREEKLTARANTLREEIVRRTEEYNGIIDSLKAINTIKSVKVGDRASGSFGRADTARQVEGVVIGVDTSGPTVSVKILVGTGFDTDVLILNESNITAVVAAEPIQ